MAKNELTQSQAVRTLLEVALRDPALDISAAIYKQAFNEGVIEVQRKMYEQIAAVVKTATQDSSASVPTNEDGTTPYTEG